MPPNCVCKLIPDFESHLFYLYSSVVCSFTFSLSRSVKMNEETSGIKRYSASVRIAKCGQ